MKRLLVLAATLLVVTVVAVVALPSPASGAKAPTLTASLTGYQEVPAVSTTGSGSFTGRINPDQSIDWRLSYKDLESPAAQAHIHFGNPDTNGGVSVFLCTNLGNAPPGVVVQACPAAGGTISGTFTAADVVGPSGQGIAAGEFDELVAAILAGATYANVHSTMFPGGEIRGEIG